MPTALPLHLCIRLQALIGSPAMRVPYGHPVFSGIVCVDGIDRTFHQAVRKKKSTLFPSTKAAAVINYSVEFLSVYYSTVSVRLPRGHN